MVILKLIGESGREEWWMGFRMRGMGRPSCQEVWRREQQIEKSPTTKTLKDYPILLIILAL